MNANKRKGNKTILSEEHQKLLVEICESFGSADIACKEPNFVLGELLKELNEAKTGNGCVWDLLDCTINKTPLKSRLEHLNGVTPVVA